MLLTIVSFLLVMGVIVFVHELGHFLVAKRNKIVVEEFGFGYPPHGAEAVRTRRHDLLDQRHPVRWILPDAAARMIRLSRAASPLYPNWPEQPRWSPARP